MVVASAINPPRTCANIYETADLVLRVDRPERLEVPVWHPPPQINPRSSFAPARPTTVRTS